MLDEKRCVNGSLFQGLSNDGSSDVGSGFFDIDVLEQLHKRARSSLVAYLQSIDAPTFVIELHSDLLALTMDMMSRKSAEDVSIFDWDIQMLFPSIVSNVAKVEKLL